MIAWLRLFGATLYRWTFVHPETGAAVLILCTAVSVSIYIATRSWGKK
jgi:hypothetical protein